MGGAGAVTVSPIWKPSAKTSLHPGLIHIHAHTSVIKHTENFSLKFEQTSLLRRLQAQTLPDEAPPIGKIHSFSKMALTFKLLWDFDALRDLESS